MRLHSCGHRFPVSDIKMGGGQWITLTAPCLLYIKGGSVSDGASASCADPEWRPGRQNRPERHLWEFPVSPDNVWRIFFLMIGKIRMSHSELQKGCSGFGLCLVTATDTHKALSLTICWLACTGLHHTAFLTCLLYLFGPWSEKHPPALSCWFSLREYLV